jgi:dTDP-4-dehydrorhamnose reductase
MREILVLGGSGQVGTELSRAPVPDGWTVVAPPRAACDLADAASVRAIVAARPWAAVINAAAYTAVDRAETEPVEAWTLNALGPAVLAKATGEAGIPLVHVSTDYVFSGDLDRPYREDDTVGPVGVYGASKEGGEQAVRTGNPRHAILRTAWVVSAHRANFLKTMLRLAAEREEIRVVADQRGCPTSARDLARALLAVARRLAEDPAASTGTFHAVNAGETTWADFAAAIMAASAARGGPHARIVPIATADYPTPARRPANSRLAADRLASAFDIRLRPWQEATDEIVSELIG